jgi:hypothetical protein
MEKLSLWGYEKVQQISTGSVKGFKSYIDFNILLQSKMATYDGHIGFLNNFKNVKYSPCWYENPQISIWLVKVFKITSIWIFYKISR